MDWNLQRREWSRRLGNSPRPGVPRRRRCGPGPRWRGYNRVCAEPWRVRLQRCLRHWSRLSKSEPKWTRVQKIKAQKSTSSWLLQDQDFFYNWVLNLFFKRSYEDFAILHTCTVVENPGVGGVEEFQIFLSNSEWGVLEMEFYLIFSDL